MSVTCVAPSSTFQEPLFTREGAGSSLRPLEFIDVDNFAGGGGVGMGFEMATGKAFDYAVNHDPQAIEMHAANHPATKHLCENVWKVRPEEVAQGRMVRLVWGSPACDHFSGARGGKPVENRIRGLAWVLLRWARRTKPRLLILENVREFRDWGPLKDGRPDPDKLGLTYKQFVGCFRSLGYQVDDRILNCADYGAPTLRKRLFMIAKRGRAPVWPKHSHGSPKARLTHPELLPHRTTAECVEWSIPCPSIFDRKKPLAEKTQRRIALGIIRYVLENPRPFIVPVNHSGDENRARAIDRPMSTLTASRCEYLVTPTLVQTGYGERPGQEARALDIEKPLGTIVGTGKHALVSALIAKHYGGVVGHEATRPLGTITGTDHHSVVSANLVKFRGDSIGTPVDAPCPTITGGAGSARPAGAAHALGIAAATLTQFRGSNRGNGGDVHQPAPTQTGQNKPGLVYAFLTKYFGAAAHGQRVDEPAHTLTGKHRHGLVTVELGNGDRGVVVNVPASDGVAGGEYIIADIGLRMLTPRELARCQGFPDSYILTGTQSNQVARIGNSVPPQVVEALVRANLDCVGSEVKS